MVKFLQFLSPANWNKPENFNSSIALLAELLYGKGTLDRFT